MRAWYCLMLHPQPISLVRHSSNASVELVAWPEVWNICENDVAKLCHSSGQLE